MSKAYIIDGRDPIAKGYVKVGRDANARELVAINKALKEMGVDTKATAESNAANTSVYVYGRLDDVYGWTVIGFLSKKIFENGTLTARYLILGDCMDVLEEPYNKLLTLQEVYDYMADYDANTANAGCALEAGYDWGLFIHPEPVQNKGFDRMWVLTIQVHDQFFPEVHKTFEGAIKSAIEDVAEHNEDSAISEAKCKDVKKALETDRYWEDETNDLGATTIYDLCQCPVCD